MSEDGAIRMTQEQPETNGQDRPNGSAAPTDSATAREQPEPAAPRQPSLQCPFCGGRRFDFGRDVYAGPDRLLYCRKSPRAGQPPEEGYSLPMKGAVCLDCGYVAMMVDLVQLHSPIRRRMDAASATDALARQAGAAAHLARSPEEQAAKALGKMGTDRGGPEGLPDVAEGLEILPSAPPAPTPRRGAAGDGFDDLEKLLEEAEQQTGIHRSIFGPEDDA